MLVLTRKVNESIRIADGITVTVVRVEGKTVRLGIVAPRSVRVLRAELPVHDPAGNEVAADGVTGNGVTGNGVTGNGVTGNGVTGNGVGQAGAVESGIVAKKVAGHVPGEPVAVGAVSLAHGLHGRVARREATGRAASEPLAAADGVATFGTAGTVVGESHALNDTLMPAVAS